MGESAVNEVEVMRLSEDELKLVRLYRQMTPTDQKLGLILFDRLSLNNEETLYPSNIYQHHNNVAIGVMKSTGDVLENRWRECNDVGGDRG